MTISDNIMNAQAAQIAHDQRSSQLMSKNIFSAHENLFLFLVDHGKLLFVKSRLCRGGGGESRQSPFVFASGIAAGASCV